MNIRERDPDSGLVRRRQRRTPETVESYPERVVLKEVPDEEVTHVTQATGRMLSMGRDS
jgi:hypothetical protein